MDKSGIGAGFLRELRFPLPIYITSTSPQSSSLSPEAGTIGQEWPQCQPTAWTRGGGDPNHITAISFDSWRRKVSRWWQKTVFSAAQIFTIMWNLCPLWRYILSYNDSTFNHFILNWYIILHINTRL
jgi:hypothetical protein